MKIAFYGLCGILTAFLAYAALGALTEFGETVRSPVAALLGYLCFVFLRWIAKT